MSEQRQNTERRKLIYSGRVQGVGFRYTTVSIARRYPVTGYVRNRRDGAVEVVADGKPHDLDAFLGDLEAAFRGNIEDRRSLEPETGERFATFEVRY